MKLKLFIACGAVFTSLIVLTGGCGKAVTEKEAEQLESQPPAVPQTPAPIQPAPPTKPAAQKAPEQTPAPQPKAKQPATTKPDYVIATDNIVKNPSFELPLGEGVIPWWPVGKTVSAGLDDTTAYDGKQSLRIDVANKMNLGIPQGPADVQAERRYLLRGFIKTQNLTGEARLEVQDAQQGYQAFVKFTPSVTGTRDWTPVSAQFVVPKGTTSLNVLLRHPAVEKDEGNEGKAWFDRVELFGLGRPVGPTMLRNGGFEEGGNGLSFWANLPEGVAAAKASKGAAQGKSCLEITLAQNKSFSVAQPVDVKQETTYALLGQIKCKDLRGTARLEVQDAKGGWQSFVAFDKGVSGTQNWTPQSLVFEVPKGINQLQVLLRVLAPEEADNAECMVWFDDYQLYEVVQ
jgi:hypothetical protein